MTEQEIQEIEQYLNDTIIEKPHAFSVGESHYFLYPVTLGKMYVLQGLIKALEINMEYLQVNIHAEALRLAKSKKSECLNIICIHTCKTKEEVCDPFFVDKRVKEFEETMSEEDIAVLMIVVLTSDKTSMFIKHLGIDKEQEDMKKVMDVKTKNDKNNYTFGGKSIYGSFIAPLLEMGFSWDEIMWQRSYTNLRLILADKINSIYVTDDERKKINITRDRERVNGDNREEILKAIASQSWD